MTDIQIVDTPLLRGVFRNHWALFGLLVLTAFLCLVVGLAVCFKNSIPHHLVTITVVWGVVALIGDCLAIWIHRAAFASLSWDETGLSFRLTLLFHVPKCTIAWSDIKRIEVSLKGGSFDSIATAIKSFEKIRAINHRLTKVVVRIEGQGERIILDSTMYPEIQMLEILRILARGADKNILNH